MCGCTCLCPHPYVVPNQCDFFSVKVKFLQLFTHSDHICESLKCTKTFKKLHKWLNMTDAQYFMTFEVMQWLCLALVAKAIFKFYTGTWSRFDVEIIGE